MHPTEIADSTRPKGSHPSYCPLQYFHHLRSLSVKRGFF
jgi:hypothetical protein